MERYGYSYETTIPETQIWTKYPIEDRECSEISFQSTKKIWYRLQRYDSEVKAKEISISLRKNWHPNYAQMTAIFQVDVYSSDVFFIAFQKEGESLKEFLAVQSNKNLFQIQNHFLLTPFYQNIIFNLLRVFHHIQKQRPNIKCKLSLENVCITIDGDLPRVSLVQFEESENSSWEVLAAFIETVNTEIGYQTYGSSYMKNFLDVLRSSNKSQIGKLDYQPLLWTISERASFTVDLAEVYRYKSVKNRLDATYFMTERGVHWRDAVEADPIFRQLRTTIDNYEISLGRVPLNDATPKGFLDLIRKSIEHIKGMPQVPQQVQRNKESVQQLFEKKFPNFMCGLQIEWVSLSAGVSGSVIPHKPMVMKLYEEEKSPFDKKKKGKPRGHYGK